MNEWEDLPKINIAFYGYDKNGVLKEMSDEETARLALKQKKKQKKEL